MKRDNGKWGLDKRIGLASCINLVQLITIVWFGSSFYTTVNNNQAITEKRFAEFAEQRKVYNDQMGKMQEAIVNLTINTSSMAKDITTQSTTMKEISDMLRSQPTGRR